MTDYSPLTIAERYAILVAASVFDAQPPDRTTIQIATALKNYLEYDAGRRAAPDSELVVTPDDVHLDYPEEGDDGQ
jgi:hypothetical protein